MTLAEIVFAQALGAAGVEEPGEHETPNLGVTRFVIAGNGYEFTLASLGEGRQCLAVYRPEVDARLLFSSRAAARETCRIYQVDLRHFRILPVSV